MKPILASVRMRIVASVLVVIAALAFNVAIGAVSIPWLELFQSRETMSERLLSLQFIVSLRLLHAVAAFFTGVGLALVGSVLQRLLRNPLADPFVLGITAGGTFSAVSAIVLGLPFFFYGLPVRMIAALCGALLSLGIMLLIRRYVFRGNDAYGVPVAGMMLNALFGALLMLVLVFADPARIGEAQRWLLGDIQTIGPKEMAAVVTLVTVGGLALIRLAPAVGALAFGEEFAQSLGFNAVILKRVGLLLSAILTAVVVSVAGSVGFVGLVVPHLARWLIRSHLAAEWVVSALTGGALVLFADALARSVAAPTELPVGIFTALIGVPALCFMAIKAGGRRDSAA
jgi:iron complex transport system permease protein